MNKLFHILFIISLSIISLSCSKNKDEKESIFEKKRIEPNVDERMKAARDAGGGIFNTSRSKGTTTFEFSSSNVLWRATLQSFETIPLSNVDYSGGIILTDWYSNSLNSNESIKIKIQFNSNELATNSVSVISHKRICDLGNCQTTQLDDNFNAKIKDAILAKARLLKIQQENDKNKK
jgi:hypothetical protein